MNNDCVIKLIQDMYYDFHIMSLSEHFISFVKVQNYLIIMSTYIISITL